MPPAPAPIQTTGAAPSAPTGLTPSAGSNVMELSWSANTETDLAGYHVYRSATSGGPYTQLTTSPVTGTSYTDTTVTNGNTYYYVIRAVDTSSQCSGNSNQVAVSPVWTSPTAVTGTATSTTTSSATLNGQVGPNWNATTWWFEYGTSTSYGQSTAVASLPGVTTLNPVSANVAGLAAGSTYHFRVVTRWSDGTTTYGSDGTFTTAPLATPPAAPKGLAPSAGSNKVLLYWSANTETDLAGYSVYRSATSGGPYTQLTTSPVTGTSYTDTTVTNGNTYYYVIRAVDTSSLSSGNSNQVAVSPVWTSPTAVTGAATSTTRSSATLNGQVGPNWNATTWWLQYGTSTSYGKSTVHSSLPALKTLNAVSALVSGLSAGKTYHFRLVARWSDGTTTYGSDRTFTTSRLYSAAIALRTKARQHPSGRRSTRHPAARSRTKHAARPAPRRRAKHTVRRRSAPRRPVR